MDLCDVDDMDSLASMSRDEAFRRANHTMKLSRGHEIPLPKGTCTDCKASDEPCWCGTALACNC